MVSKSTYGKASMSHCRSILARKIASIFPISYAMPVCEAVRDSYVSESIVSGLPLADLGTTANI
jgi:hypothetical protein